MYALTHCLPPVKLPPGLTRATLALRQLRGPDSGPRVRTRTDRTFANFKSLPWALLLTITRDWSLLIEKVVRGDFLWP